MSLLIRKIKQNKEILADHSLWLEAFVTINIAFLTLDIYLAHSFNSFRKMEEYAPFYFSMIAPIFLTIGLVGKYRYHWLEVWTDIGYLVGYLSVGMGLVGVVLHLDSQFFSQRTIKSLVYGAPFAAPLSYTGLGFLLIMNRMVADKGKDWANWVIFFALGGFVGNFIFSLTDHAQNGFFHWSEWIPVASSAMAVGALISLFIAVYNRSYLYFCSFILLLQAIVGVLGFYLHAKSILNGPSIQLSENIINQAPLLAPLLFPNLVLLSAIGLWRLQNFLPSVINKMPIPPSNKIEKDLTDW